MSNNGNKMFNTKYYKIVFAFLVLFIGVVVFSLLQTENDQSHEIFIGDTKNEDAGDFIDATPLSVSFEVTNPYIPSVPSGLTCEEATSVSNAFATYQMLRTTLGQSVDPRKVEYLDCFLPENKISSSSRDTHEEFMRSVFSSDVMYSYLSAAFEAVLYKTVEEGNLRHGKLAWGSGHLGNSALLAYKSTGEKRFVELYVNYFERVLELRDTKLGLFDGYHNKVMNSWGSANLGRNSGDTSSWVAHVTHFSVIMVPATGFAQEIKTNSELSEFEPFADQVIDFFNSAYREFDVDLRPAEGTNEVWYWRPLIDKFEATNHLHIQGQALLNMYALTEQQFYADRVNWIIRVFEKGVEIDEDGFIAWNYHPYLQIESAMQDRNAREYSEFVWKASLTVPFIFEAAAAGFDVDPSIVEATTKTILEHVVANNAYALNLHPNNYRPIEDRRAKLDSAGPAASITGFLSDVAKEPEIAGKILEIVATRPDLYAKGWFVSEKMSRGYAFFLSAQQ